MITPFKLDNDTKNAITEISALGGYTRSVVKEVLERSEERRVGKV